MRSNRTLTVRLASLGGALALVGAGLVGSVGLGVVSGGIAGADTPPYSAVCTLMVSGNPVPATLTGLVTTGSLSPAAPAAGQTFTLTNFAQSFSFGSLATAIIGDTISGTVMGSVTASGATPASQAVTFTIPSTVVVANQPPIAAPGSAVSFTAGSGSPPPSVSTSNSVSLNLTISGPIGNVTGTCTTPPEVIAAAPAPAAITAVLPNAGPTSGGTTVIIHGSGIGSPTAVNFGSTPATSFTALTPASVRAVAPPGAPGPVAVSVTTPTGLTNKVSFTYTNGPIVTGLSPNSGNPSGGASVIVTGQQLSGATAVDFGSTPATSFAVNSDTSITAVAPAGSGVVNVTVTNPIGVSVVSSQTQFNYQAGYWLAAADGGVFTYGNSPFEGSAGAITLNKPMVGMAATPGGFGYWLVASDGGVFSYGDAQFFGSTGAITLNKPMVGMASTPDGGGYWLVASDGGVFSYGDAAFFGSLGGTPLRGQVAGIASTPDGGGYWLVTSDGGVFPFGDAGFFGSASGVMLNQPIVGTASSDAGGYWLGASDGGIFNYGDATFYGSAGGMPLNQPVVGLAAAG